MTKRTPIQSPALRGSHVPSSLNHPPPSADTWRVPLHAGGGAQYGSGGLPGNPEPPREAPKTKGYVWQRPFSRRVLSHGFVLHGWAGTRNRRGSCELGRGGAPNSATPGLLPRTAPRCETLVGLPCKSYFGSIILKSPDLLPPGPIRRTHRSRVWASGRLGGCSFSGHHRVDSAPRPVSVGEMRSRSNSGVRLDGYARLVQQTILCYQVNRHQPKRTP